VTGFINSANYPVKHTVSPCGSLYLWIYDPTGDLLQSTYIAGVSNSFGTHAVAVGPNSTVYVAGPADAEFVPTYQIGVEDRPLLITRLSPNADVEPVQLVCVGNAASNRSGPVAAGEIVSLFGMSLGPAEAA